MRGRGQNGEGCPSPQPTRGSGEHHKLPSGVQGGAPADHVLVHFEHLTARNVQRCRRV